MGARGRMISILLVDSKRGVYLTNSLSGTRCEAHQDTAGKKPTIRALKTKPDGCAKIHGIAQHIRQPPAVLVGDGDPDEVSQTLEQGGGCEEIRNLGHRGVEELRALAGMGTRKKIHGHLNDGDGRAGSQEVAHKHSKADDGCHPVLEPLGPVCVNSV